ncbi:TetR family transcriptional regulator [Longimycelium tulufanense]|uniref:TetR family transcriptional regulator n=1 Tax=Longimycelium tulufanense TaxID=907463 RepID=A0A8J3CCG9_9PSEU|nr:TetR/AcrR family transcriptional regulator [Longimycelium tulufanense]GGM73906.1 TetR family transcriptional regulator [Longimycelium tulufanense]
MAMHHSGSGDPARSLALLWRTSERPGRKGKADLTVDRIVRAAMEVADTDGVAALSMRRVAERLGVGTMSLYTYVPGKAELIDVMLDAAYGELPLSGELAGGWRERLEFIARQNWALYHRHPWMLQVGRTRPPLGPNGMAKYDYELRAVAGIGLTDLEMDSVITLVVHYVEAAARGSVEAAQAEQHTGMTDEQWWQAQAPLLEKLVDFGRYPVASRVGTAVGVTFNSPYAPEHNFEFGLQRVLDGIASFLQTRAEKPAD